MAWQLMRFFLLISILSPQFSFAATSITGAGATFPFPLYAKWAADYYNKTGVQINYQSIGSGAGIKQVAASTIDFGASDKPLNEEELKAQGLIQFPTVLGAVVPVVNLPGLEPGSLRLTGSLLADIFLGKVNTWSDPAIKALNPQVNLPDLAITVVHRSDGSGTSFLFTNYLSKVSPDWANRVGFDTSVNWPVGIAGKGNEGVALYVKKVSGSLGYVEYNYAVNNHLLCAELENKDKAFVQPSMDTVRAAASYADWNQTLVILTNEPGKNSWPITGATFILIPAKAKDVDKTKAVLSFFSWAFQEGKEDAASLMYVTLPDELIKKIKENWALKMSDMQGKPVWSN